MRKERPMFADIYPAGTTTCAVCGTKNLAGESFNYHIWTGEHCSDCHKVKVDKEQAEQTTKYQSGDEEPEDTDEITCPWCGHEQSDSGEASDSDDEVECDNCENVYSYERNVMVSYSSSRVEKD